VEGGVGGTQKEMLTRNVYNIDFYEFVDCLGRIAVVVYKLNPGAIKNAPTNLRHPEDIIASFFRHQMCLFEGSTLKREAGWRRTVKRPWEAHDRLKRMSSPKAMMRPPLPGEFSMPDFGRLLL
jgi:hypothetical protein